MMYPYKNKLYSLKSLGQFIALLGVFIFMMLSINLRFGEAQTPNKTPTDKNSQNTISGNGKVIEFKQLKLEGTVQRPSAAYLSSRRKLKFKGIVPKKSFISKIKQSVSKPPF